MTRLVCLVAALSVLLAAQPATQRGPIIRWQPTNGPLGGEADSILVHAGQLVVPLHNVGAWRSRDRGKSWQLVREREESWGMTKAGPDLFVLKRRGLHRAADIGGPWVTCGAVPRAPGTYGHLIDAGARSSTSSWMSGCFDRATNVRPGRPLWCPGREPDQPSMSCSPAAR